MKKTFLIISLGLFCGNWQERCFVEEFYVPLSSAL